MLEMASKTPPKPPPPDRATFGARVRLAIGERGITEVAEAAGLRPQSLHAAMKGGRPIPAEQLVGLLRYCGTTPDAVFPPGMPAGSLAKLEKRTRALWASRTIVAKLGDKPGMSDLPVTVSARLVPRDLAQYFLERGQVDGVTDEDRDDLIEAAFLEDTDRPRSPDFYSGILTAIRRARASAGAGRKGR